MRIRGAVIMQVPGTYEVVELELDDPRQNEVRVRLVAAGLCHSDDHIGTGDIRVGIYPYCGGHEGAGVVDAVGPNTPGFEVGDHVILSFSPSCGKCKWCSQGMSNLCDLGAAMLTGARADDLSSFRLHMADGTPVGQMCGISTFSTFTVASTTSVIKIPKHLPLDKMALLSCGVGTGWGSAVNSADVQPGDVVIVMGVGGVGINAVQGAAQAGAKYVIAVDPVAFKRQKALELGATHAVADMGEATDIARSFTNGQGADSAIVTIGIVQGGHIAEAFAAIRKAGTVVVTGLGDIAEVGIPISFGELTLFQKRLQGSEYGQCNPFVDIPREIEMYEAGKLKLDELITATYTLDEVAEGYADMHAGKNIRGVILFD